MRLNRSHLLVSYHDIHTYRWLILNADFWSKISLQTGANGISSLAVVCGYLRHLSSTHARHSSFPRAGTPVDLSAHACVKFQCDGSTFDAIRQQFGTMRRAFDRKKYINTFIFHYAGRLSVSQFDLPNFSRIVIVIYAWPLQPKSRINCKQSIEESNKWMYSA